MKFGVVNKSTILNRFVLHTLQRNITHLAVITRETNLKLWKRAGKEPKFGHYRVVRVIWESSENQFGRPKKRSTQILIFLKIRPPPLKKFLEPRAWP